MNNFSMFRLYWVRVFFALKLHDSWISRMAMRFNEAFEASDRCQNESGMFSDFLWQASLSSILSSVGNCDEISYGSVGSVQLNETRIPCESSLEFVKRAYKVSCVLDCRSLLIAVDQIGPENVFLAIQNDIRLVFQAMIAVHV